MIDNKIMNKIIKDGRFQLTPNGDDEMILDLLTLHSQISHIVSAVREIGKNPEDIDIILSDVEGNNMGFIIPETELLEIINEKNQVKTSLLIKHYSDYDYLNKIYESRVKEVKISYEQNSKEN